MANLLEARRREANGASVPVSVTTAPGGACPTVVPVSIGSLAGTLQAEDTDPISIVTAPRGVHSSLNTARAYAGFGERPIPLCDPRHAFVSRNHAQGYQRRDGTSVPACAHPGKAPLEREYPRFAHSQASDAELARMFACHRGNTGGVVPDGRITLDIDPRSRGLESVDAYVKRCGTLPWTPTVLTGGGGVHYHFAVPSGVHLSAGGSLTLRPHRWRYSRRRC